jgi:hypothetical protein
MADKEEMYQLSKDVLNNVLQYLSGRPYAEVASLIATVQIAQPVVAPESPKSDKKSKKADAENKTQGETQ